jgi:hypothetical protein
MDAMDSLLKTCVARQAVFHLWGHSWEIEEHNLWHDLDAFLAKVAQLSPATRTVSQLANTIAGRALTR